MFHHGQILFYSNSWLSNMLSTLQIPESTVDVNVGSSEWVDFISNCIQL